MSILDCNNDAIPGGLTMETWKSDGSPEKALVGIDKLAERALALVLKYTPPEMMGARRGGVITARVILSGNTLPPRQVGELDPKKLDEKLGHLFRKWNVLACSGHVSTFVDRNEAHNIWGGGIIADGLIIAFSGLPEECDEALCMILACWTRMLSLSRLEQILSHSRNQVWPRIPQHLLVPQEWSQ